MNTSLRWTVSALALLVAGIAVAIDYPSWTQARSATSNQGTLLMSGPSQQSQVLQKRIHAKNAIAERLLEGELTLAEAAAWFRDLNANPPRYASDFRANFPGDTDAEKLSRQVIAWIKTLLHQGRTPSEAQAILARLEEQLCAMLARGDDLPW